MHTTHHLRQMIYPDFKILQANLRKSKDVSQSLFNDDALQSYSAILITKPWAKLNGQIPYTTPFTHMYWQPFFPSCSYTPERHTTSPAFCAMIWINKSHANIQQVEVIHQDICLVILTLGNRKIFLASIYIPCS